MIPDWEFNCIFLADKLQKKHPELFSQLVSILTTHGIEVRILSGVKDIWAKDYSPIQVGPDRFVHFRYEPDYLKGNPELRTGREVAKLFKEFGNCLSSDINLDGGNIVTSGKKAIVTDKIYRENPTWKRDELRRELCRLLEIDQLIVIPKEPYDLIGHADGMVRFIDESRVLVNDYTAIDPGFGNRLLAALARHRLEVIPLPYFNENLSQAGDLTAVGCYANFLLTKQVLIAPIFHHFFDAQAFSIMRAAFPDLPVNLLDSAFLAQDGGVLNCIFCGYSF